MRRIAIIGTPGAGKSTLARRVSAALELPAIDLDDLFWGHHWAPAPVDVFRERVRYAVRGHAWVCSGNHIGARDLVWTRAEAVVWLDYPAPVGVGRLLQRAGQQIADRIANRRKTFFSQDSLLLSLLRARQERSANFSALLSSPNYGHLQLIRLRSQHELDAWFGRVAAAAHAPPGSFDLI